MTQEHKDKIKKFYVGATFGCADNPSCYVCSAENLVNELGLCGDNLRKDLLDKISRHINWRGNDTIRFVFVEEWIKNQLKQRSDNYVPN